MNILAKFYLLLFCLIGNFIFSQKEWFIKINPMTGNYNVIDSIPGVKFLTQNASAYNSTGKQFYFIGATSNFVDHLYTINVNNGGVVNSPTLNITSQQYISNLEFDQSNSTLYALLNNNSQSLTQLIKINPANASYTVIGTYTMNTSINHSTFNQNQKQFIFKSMSVATNSLTLYTLNVLTGAIISSPLFPPTASSFDSFTYLEYSATQNKLYSLYYNSSQNKEYLLEINNTTGSTVSVGQISNVTSVGNLACYDDFNNKLIFESVQQATNNRNIYSVNSSNASVISNPNFPIDIINDLEAEMQIDNANGNVYALLWSANPNVGLFEKDAFYSGINIYPNPVKDELNISFNAQTKMEFLNVSIYNSIGQLIREEEISFKKNSANIKTSELPNGVYVLKLTQNNSLTQPTTISKRIVVAR